MNSPDDPAADQTAALATAETALSRIQRHVQAARDETITAGEALEQILDELEGHSALGRVRQALRRSFDASRPH